MKDVRDDNAFECRLILQNMLMMYDKKGIWDGMPGDVKFRELMDSRVCDGVVSPAVAHALREMRGSLVQEVGENRATRILEYTSSKQDAAAAAEAVTWHLKRKEAEQGLNMTWIEKLSYWWQN